MATHPWITLPLDPVTSETLAAGGLEYRSVPVDGEQFVPFIGAIRRGFLDEHPTDEQIEASRERVQDRRLTGVYDRAALDPATPVATIDSWMTELSMPGGTTIPMWAISGVTVSPTRRRRGIARAMLEGELRTAAAAGYAMAGLTVTEATIYGRYGFAPATFATRWVIDTQRARWIGPVPQGRLDAVDRERLRVELADLHDRTRRSRPGEVEGWTGLWRRIAGVAPGDDQRKVRGVVYSDQAGLVRGVMAYTIAEGHDDYAKSELTIAHLISDGQDAYRALWRFALEHDLVSTVRASLRSVDEPLRWMIADQRGAQVTVGEHGWIRVLDVPGALGARTYATVLDLTLGIEDALGFAHGVWQLSVDESGHATVEPVDTSPDITMGVAELGSILLGGVRPTTLHAADRMSGSAAAVAALERAFVSAHTPHLSLWY